MKSLPKYLYILAVSCAFTLPSWASANTLTNTYVSAFTDPDNFEDWLFLEFMEQPAYFQRFRECSERAIELLGEIERQHNREHASCNQLPRCSQLAKEIQSVRSLRLNIENLGAYVRNVERDEPGSFSDSAIGRIIYQIPEEIRANLNNNPEFARQVYVLSNVPCS